MRYDRRSVWWALALATGFCSLVYELTMAQLLTGLLGNSLARFATTIGVYIVGMGLGSVSFRETNTERDGQVFLTAELCLFAIGFLSPALFVGIHHLSLVVSQDSGLQSDIVLTLTHLIIFLTGFFCGLEIPSLASLSSKSLSSSHAGTHVLAADYAGMFVASLIFPFFLFPTYGLMASFAFATFLNLVCALATYLLLPTKRRWLEVVFVIFFLLNVGIFIYASDLQDWLSHVYATTS